MSVYPQYTWVTKRLRGSPRLPGVTESAPQKGCPRCLRVEYKHHDKGICTCMKCGTTFTTNEPAKGEAP